MPIRRAGDVHVAFMLALIGACCALPTAAASDQPATPEETAEQAARRRERVAQRRAGVDIICHRGASEFAHENTLEAYRAAFELGADGNEIDIRATRDGVLVCFHDDMLDQILEAYGDLGDYTWQELEQFAFRNPGRFGAQCRIPTLAEVFELHRRHAGLLHLDIKRPGLDRAIAELLTTMQMWDHVAYCNADHGGVILTDPRLRLRRYKASLYADHADVFVDAVLQRLALPGDGLIVDDPRAPAVALGRKLGSPSRQPVAPRPLRRAAAAVAREEAALLAVLRDAADWNVVAETTDQKAASGLRIRARAQAADALAALPARDEAAFRLLEERVRNRSLHKEWMFHGLDGAMALRALLMLQAPNAVEAARFALFRDDPALEAVMDPRFKNPRSWTDSRVKMVIFPALARSRTASARQLCQDYLALTDAEARAIGPGLFEQAARALLELSPQEATALELLGHRLQVVRGRAILDCLARAQEPWATAALKKAAPAALNLLSAD
jgi:hypothetical protein